MTDNTPSSLICFKNGYSYVNIPVTLAPDPEKNEHSGIKECQVGPLPNFAVHGTVALAPHDPQTVKIFSLSQAAKKVIKPSPLKISEDAKDYSYAEILQGNIGTAVRVMCINETSNGRPCDGTLSFEGIVKAVHTDNSAKGQSLVVLKSLNKNGGERLIKCSSIVNLETIQIRDQFTLGKFK